jgi:hypothetical protein
MSVDFGQFTNEGMKTEEMLCIVRGINDTYFFFLEYFKECWDLKRV